MAVITRLDWQRVQMEVTCVSDCPLEALGLAKKGTKEIVRLSELTVNGKEYSCVNNLAAMREETFLDNGSYYFVCLTDGSWNKCQVSTEVGYSLPDKTRVFRYCTNLYYAETVDFWIETDEKDKDLYLVMNHYFMKENSDWKVRNYAEAFEGKKKLKEWAHGVAVWGLNVVYNVLYALRKHDGKHILLMSETRPYLWGNLLAVDTELKNMGMDREYTVSYSFRKSVGESQGFASWLKLVGLLSKQDYVFVDDYTQIFNFLQLNPKTVLTQTWHAAVGFKAIGYSRYGKESSPFPIACCHKRYTYAVVATEKLVDIYAERFGLSKERFLPYGMPRLDQFLDADVIASTKQKVYETYPFLRDKQVILFAPTYRGANQKSAYYPYEKLDYGRIDAYCRKHNAVFFMKMHPFVKNGVVIPEEYKDTIVNGSDYQNINDLYYVSDIMITDYSSCFYEYSLLKRPVLFYTYDRNVYELTRGVHADVAATAPGKVCDTFDELMKAMETEDYDLDKTRKFVEDNFGDYAGGSSRKIIEHVILGKDRR